MASNGNLKYMNTTSGDPVIGYVEHNTPQLATNIENHELKHRMKVLEELLNDRLNKADVLINKLQQKIEILEEQATQHKTQIKQLEDKLTNLQHHGSNETGILPMASVQVKESSVNQTHVIIRREVDNHFILLSMKNLACDTEVQNKPGDVITYKSDHNLQNQERGIIVQLGSEEILVEKLQSLNLENTNKMNSTPAARNSNTKNEEKTYENKNKSETLTNEISSATSKSAISNSNPTLLTTSSKDLHNVVKDQDTIKHTESKGETNDKRAYSSSENSTHDGKTNQSMECSKDSSQKGRSVASINSVFTRWMQSRDDDYSLWSKDRYRNPLLAYIGRIYGQKNRVRQVVAPLMRENNKFDELDLLYAVIKRLSKQPGAQESIQEWRTNTRSGHRLTELKTIIEYNSAYPVPLGDLTISPSDLEEIIVYGSVNAYFDMICRDGVTTAEIGDYFRLSKENIFGGNEYHSHNERIKFVNVNLSQSIIDLGDNRVDLITCLATLHYVPQLNLMLLELARILRPGGHLILREHDCKKQRSLTAKYLNFIHAFMMIARVGEFADASANHLHQNKCTSDDDPDSDTNDWDKQKSDIIQYTNSIHYRTRGEWHQELERVGFRLKATIDYDLNISSNPQELFYAVYQLDAK